MNWTTVVFSMTAAACFTLGMVHFAVWWRQRDGLANLMFTLLAAGTAGLAVCEMLMIRAETPEAYSQVLRWYQLPVWVAVLGVLGFIHFYLGSPRRLLAWLVAGLRSAALILNFTSDGNLNFLKILSLNRVTVFGESLAMPAGIPNPAMMTGQASLILLAVYAVDAMVWTWRRGSRRAAVMAGGGTVLFVLAGAAQALLIFWGIIQMPPCPSLFFGGIVAVMGYELSSGLLRASGMARALQQRETELLETRERLALAAESSNAGFWGLDPATGVFWVPPETLQLFDFPPSTVLNLETFLDGVYPDDRREVREAIRHALDSGEPVRVEYRTVTPGGQIRWFVSLGRSRTDEHGTVTGLTGVTINITNRKEIEQELMRERALTQAVFDSVPGLLYLYNDEGRIVRWNKKHEDLTGYSAADISRMSFADWFDAADLPPVAGEWNKVFTSGRAMTEAMIRMKDGSKVPFLATGVRLEIEGKPHMVGIAIDITEQKRLELESSRNMQELAHISRVALMGELTAALAHELNQPLTAILSNAQAARRFLSAPVPDLVEVGEILQDIVADDQRAGEVIRRLRDLLKKGSPGLTVFDVNDVVRAVERIVGSDAVIRSTRLEFQLTPGLPLVRGDRIQLEQVILNLVINAFDAVKEADRERRKVILSTRAGDGMVQVSVRDCGPGISAGQAERIFDAFFTSKAEGMGMGLWISRSIIERHGGRIWAENSPGGGAVFHFTMVAESPSPVL